MLPELKSIAVILPVFNEASIVKDMVASVDAFAKENPHYCFSL
jgi:hypothetical protein